MHHLLTIIRNVSVHEDFVGRRDLRPGAIYNADETTARRLIDGGYARLLVQPSPLFVDATTPPERPKKSRRRNDGSSSDLSC